MIKEFIKKCNFDSSSIIFEIGAHMGFDTEEIYERTNKAKIYAFEPDPRNIKILKERNIGNISIIVEFAVSDQNSDGYFYLSSGEIPAKTGNDYYDNNDWSASNSLRPAKLHNEIFPWCKIEELITVKQIRLDDFCKENSIDYIDFIWMDVQGCEDLVFVGAQKILNSTKYIFTEYSNSELYEGQKTLDAILKLLPGEWFIHFHEGDNVLLENITYAKDIIKI